MKNIFNIGDIVTLKSHPLFNDNYSKINCPASQVPPLMLVKEILFEDEKKKVFSDEIENVIIADKIKYTCVFFNNNKSEFVEKSIYQSFLKSHKELKYFRKENKDKNDHRDTLIHEVDSYINAQYCFGHIVNFKTVKLENKKKFDETDYKYIHTFTSPEFLLSGLKINESKKIYYNDGKPKKITSDFLYKVLWYNHNQQKNSEIYLPIEFFIVPFVSKTFKVINKNSEILSPH